MQSLRVKTRLRLCGRNKYFEEEQLLFISLVCSFELPDCKYFSIVSMLLVFYGNKQCLQWEEKIAIR